MGDMDVSVIEVVELVIDVGVIGGVSSVVDDKDDVAEDIVVDVVEENVVDKVVVGVEENDVVVDVFVTGGDVGFMVVCIDVVEMVVVVVEGSDGWFRTPAV